MDAALPNTKKSVSATAAESPKSPTIVLESEEKQRQLEEAECQELLAARKVGVGDDMTRNGTKQTNQPRQHGVVV